MRILDAYILKKFLKTLALVISIILPIGIAIDISEKIAKFLHHSELTLAIILEDYYQHFIVTYGIQFLPLALFIAVILFTSKLAGDTEIIAMHSAQISFNRLLFPYFLGAFIVGAFLLYMNHFIVPSSNAQFTRFQNQYVFNKKDKSSINDLSLQLGDENYVFIKNYKLKTNTGTNFTFQRFEGTKLKYKLIASTVKWIEKDSLYRLRNYSKRYLNAGSDQITKGKQMDTILDFHPKDLLYIDYLSKEMTTSELSHFIEQSEKRGVKNLNPYIVELQKRSSLPFSAFILTMIAVALAAKKKRGGIGINLALGIGLAFVYIFFMKITEVLGAEPQANTLVLIWTPNIIFGILAFYLYLRAAKS